MPLQSLEKIHTYFRDVKVVDGRTRQLEFATVSPGGVAVGPGRCVSPRRPTQFEPSFTDVNATQRRGEQS
jgi:hypothetical protein